MTEPLPALIAATAAVPVALKPVVAPPKDITEASFAALIVAAPPSVQPVPCRLTVWLGTTALGVAVNEAPVIVMLAPALLTVDKVASWLASVETNTY